MKIPLYPPTQKAQSRNLIPELLKSDAAKSCDSLKTDCKDLVSKCCKGGEGGGLSTGAIIGIVAGILLVIVAIVVIWLIKKH